MKDFTKFTSPTVCLNIKDIDTDMIIAARYMKGITQNGLGEHLFENLKMKDPNFPEINGQRILVAGKNFGCGSSREHAPWSLKQAGIDVIISSDFADIFKGNAEKNGILPVVLDEEVVQPFIESGEDLTVDLENQKVIDNSGKEYNFEISGFAKKRLLENLSDLDYLLGFSDEVNKFEKGQKGKFL